MNFNEIQEIIRMVSKHKLSEFILKEGEFKLVIRNQSAQENAAASNVVIPVQQPVVAVAPQYAAPAQPQANKPAASADAPAPAAERRDAPAAEESSAHFLQIKSPMVGTFYRSPSPDKSAFVKIGDSVDAGQPVCIIEAMKLFNEIESDVKGKIVKVLVEDASPVEYDQPLFLVDPS
jgi:acetyl-CoA carboxylase biotin carboxyl carrier protein